MLIGTAATASVIYAACGSQLSVQMAPPTAYLKYFKEADITINRKMWPIWLRDPKAFSAVVEKAAG